MKFKNLNLIELADHNREAMKKSYRKAMMAILVCLIPAVVCRLFFWQYTHKAIRTSWSNRDGGYITDIGWPSIIYTWGTRFAIGFTILLLYSRFVQDLRKPSFGVASNGIFINQQMLRNAFVPWQNIQKAELLGPAESPSMKLTFKNSTNLLKGQPFLLKMIAKPWLKDDPVVSISKDETVGDIRKMYEMINDKLQDNDYTKVNETIIAQRQA